MKERLQMLEGGVYFFTSTLYFYNFTIYTVSLGPCQNCNSGIEEIQSLFFSNDSTHGNAVILWHDVYSNCLVPTCPVPVIMLFCDSVNDCTLPHVVVQITRVGYGVQR